MSEDIRQQPAQLYQLADRLYQEGRYEKMTDIAASLYNQAELEIRCSVLGEDHPQLVASLNNLVGLYVATGKLCQGRARFEQEQATPIHVLLTLV